mmetsp:Transcript_680/g.2260  ORF Transcript_680/g.2260 Transcript_680/m.2260 type:complete len:279 (+) Transcript_680:117-953(+)
MGHRALEGALQTGLGWQVLGHGRTLTSRASVLSTVSARRKSRALHMRLALPSTRAEMVDVGPYQIAINVPSDKAQLLEEYVAWNTDDKDPGGYERVPYWADLWPASVALSTHLLSCGQLLQQSRVLEIGAGLGLSGIVAHLVGAREVVLSDNDPLSILIAEKNVADNRHLLRSGAIEHRNLDWRFPDSWPGNFDCILAADVLYERQFADDLGTLIPKLLRPGGHLLMAEPTTRQNRAFFLSALKASLQTSLGDRPPATRIDQFKKLADGRITLIRLQL